MADITHAAVPVLRLRREPRSSVATTTVLLGAWLSVLERTADGWLNVKAFGQQGWVREEETGQDNVLKLFFVDVGQGDGTLIETPTQRLIVDGGPGRNFAAYLLKWKYRWLVADGESVHFDAVVVSHFDADHFDGLTALLQDRRVTIGTVFHNGIARFASSRAQRPAAYDTDLGETAGGGANRRLLTTFSSLDDAEALVARGGLAKGFESFLVSAGAAHADGRLGSLARIDRGTGLLTGFDGLTIEVLGPVTESQGPFGFRWFADSSHTRNGHSVVLKLTWGARTILLGGDLNSESEEHLLRHGIGAHLPVDVAKACHHGSSDFSIDFLAATKPKMTIVSSGDNESYGHPQPDLVGSIGKYSRGDRPLVFSTELARSTTPARIHYGLINVRTDGKLIVGAQMYEKPRAGQMWNSFVI